MSGNAVIETQAVKFVLWVRDMERAVSFYRDIFGLDVGFTSPGWSELKFGDAVIALHGGGDGARIKTGLSFQVTDAAAACEHVAAQGGQVLSEPVSPRPGEPILLAHACDLDGNAFMITQRA